MRVIESLNDIDIENDSVLTIGNFDGVHMGHQALIGYTVEKAKELNMNSVVFTFSNHPVNYFKPGSVKNIMSEQEKKDFLEKMNVDILINVPFDRYMTEVSARDYLKDIIVDRIKTKFLVVGHDFSFAKNREGSPELLEELKDEFGFGLKVFYPIKEDDVRISSTAIRNALSNGEIELANKYLGRFFLMKGKVYKSRQIGRTMGFPTANIELDNNRVIPKGGIYVSRVNVEGKYYFGATNIGFNPTVNGKRLSVETFILDFDENIYGKTITVEFIQRIRDEVKFSSKDELKNQLQKDVKYVRDNYSREDYLEQI